MSNRKVQIIVLAAGHGKRMNNHELPKVLIPFHGKPIVKHLLEAIAQSGVCDQPIIVVGQKTEMVQTALGPSYTYVFQAEQRGTGHAVACARSAVEGRAEHVMVLYGDHPLVSAETIRKITEQHVTRNAVLTMATVEVADFNDWRQGFSDFGRVVRDDQDHVSAIVERRDASVEQLNIHEINPAYFCFRADWLWSRIDQLTDQNTQHEYYLTDLAGIACREGQVIETVVIEPREALGVNTAEQLELIENLK